MSEYPPGSTAKKYYLQDGREVTLRTLIAKEPEWAYNRIIAGEKSEAERCNLVKENERLSLRDGKASVELCYKTTVYPFNRVDLEVGDFGVADNEYVVESAFVDGIVNDNEKLKEFLSISRCPNCDGSGATYDNFGNAEQCQWCYEQKELLK